ncbi:hypothetical protein DQW50_09135 [Halorubrum sp. 48-1-W]|uniref:hypothetical protein n=1 Tax=Halorubrum sp. 48-1-W TaxID=2249761 RepID=UPI000DCD7EBB|nr:hypothetical protein [Halorubrum sp. 48-1-W]RAW45493.1 hypothetical protein DQW50_09135 [Halorubrum sp. 48-1-W]
MSRHGPPGRETAAARSGERATWYGYGRRARVEKSGFGLFLHDVPRLFTEVSVLSLPVLFVVMGYPSSGWFDSKATALVAWTVAVVVSTLLRTGHVRPLATPTRGWVSLSPWLLALRVPYFNGTFWLAIFGGLAVHAGVGGVVGPGPAIGAGLGWAAVVAGAGVLAFPRAAETWLSVVR